jgi:2-polyprenyl-3-methyl-5-hydroxy-6-metoxy-1,4-benzoquinol methylase
MLFSRRIRQRRKELRARFDLTREFELVEESCVPSYVHPNPFAAWTAWRRLQVAADLYGTHGSAGPVLDFGAGTGELYALLASRGNYWFIEQNELLARTLSQTHEQARRTTLESLPQRAFGAIFALDSLEHNEDIEPLLDRLMVALAPNGAFILSGPTENWLYKLGRRIAGFDGHYHHQNIYDVERKVQARAKRVERRTVPYGVPLFSVTVWR